MANAEELIKNQAETKETEEKAKDQAFLDEFQSLVKKHLRDIGTELVFSKQGVIPKLGIVRLKPESGIVGADGQAVKA